jgi:hypothetical protein
MPTTYESIATTTLGSNTTSVTFSSIPATYTDLRVVTSNAILVPSGGGLPDNFLRINGDSGSNYSRTILYGNGTSAISERTANATSLWSYSGSSTTSAQPISITTWDFLNYSNTTTNKTVLSRIETINNSTIFITFATVQLWRSTAAINQLVFSLQASATGFITGSTFTLYGIKAA